jgi:alkyldihydroxyacetonephosphate synthase
VSFEIDRESLLVRVPGAATLGAVESAVAREGLTLGPFAKLRASEPVADWLAAGAPGASSAWSDPADHLVAGLTAMLVNGRRLELHPSPRRSVGPDLIALALGTGDRFLSVEHVWLRVALAGVRAPSVPLPRVDLDPPLSDDERILVDAIARELAGPPDSSRIPSSRR